MSTLLHNHYLHKVVALANKAVVSHPVFTEHQVLLIEMGSTIEQKHAEQLAEHKLLRPIEFDLLLEDCMDAQQLFEHISDLVHQFSDFLEIEQGVQTLEAINNFCTSFMSEPVLQQGLTIMESSLPELYRKSLFCAWFAVSLGKHEGLGNKELEHLFYAGLLHDFGMLHMPGSFATVGYKYTIEQRRKMHTHPTITYSNLQHVSGLSNTVLKSVLEHHERIDGSGYPRGLTEQQLSWSGQIIALCDDFYAIRFAEHYANSLNSLSQVLPMLQLAGDLFMQNVCDRVITLVTESCSEHLRYQRLGPDFFKSLLNRIDSLQLKSALIKKLLVYLKKNHGYEREFLPAINSAEHFIKVTQRSGVEFGSLTAWLSSLSDSSELMDEAEQLVLENLEILLEELNQLELRVQRKLFLLPKTTIKSYLDKIKRSHS